MLTRLCGPKGATASTPVVALGNGDAVPLHDAAATTISAPPATATISHAAEPVDELEAFRAEIAQLEGNGPRPGDAPGTPEEKEFEDDDGTRYVWDPMTRRFVAQGAWPSVPSETTHCTSFRAGQLRHALT